MKKYLINTIFALFLFPCFSHASDQQEISQLIKAFSQLDSLFVRCLNSDGGVTPSLSEGLKKYFTTEFYSSFRKICTTSNYALGIDPRYGTVPISNNPQDQAPRVSNIRYSNPKITGTAATIKATYDLDGAPYSDFGNYTLYKLQKEEGSWKLNDIELGGNEAFETQGMESFKSLKKKIDHDVVRVSKYPSKHSY